MNTKHSVIINTLAVFIISLALASCAQMKPTKEAAVWIDVRTPGEYATGHLENATNIPYQDIGKRITEVANSKDEKIFVYCASGHRAGIAKETLDKLGYTDVTNAGAYRDLVKKDNQAQSQN